MSHANDISQITRDTQERIFRIAQRDGLTLKAISLDSGIPYTTLRTYAGGTERATAEVPVSALRRLIGVIPDELLSLLLPVDRAIVRVPTGLDHDEVEEAAREFLRVKGEAHHVHSPAGRDLSPCETAALDQRVVALRAAA